MRKLKHNKERCLEKIVSITSSGPPAIFSQFFLNFLPVSSSGDQKNSPLLSQTEKTEDVRQENCSIAISDAMEYANNHVYLVKLS